jgi:hypothetical protein
MSRDRDGRKKRSAMVPPGLLAVCNRFPDRTDTTRQLFTENESFRTLCNDYRKCGTALRYWNRSDTESSDNRRLEYETVQRELEEEIVRFQEEFEKRRNRPAWKEAGSERSSRLTDE